MKQSIRRNSLLSYDNFLNRLLVVPLFLNRNLVSSQIKQIPSFPYHSRMSPDFYFFQASWSGAEATRTHALNTSSIYCFGVFVRFTQKQRDIVQIVADCHDLALTFAKPGLRWYDTHMAVCRLMTERRQGGSGACQGCNKVQRLQVPGQSCYRELSSG